MAKFRRKPKHVEPSCYLPRRTVNSFFQKIKTATTKLCYKENIMKKNTVHNCKRSETMTEIIEDKRRKATLESYTERVLLNICGRNCPFRQRKERVSILARVLSHRTSLWSICSTHRINSYSSVDTFRKQISEKRTRRSNRPPSTNC